MIEPTNQSVKQLRGLHLYHSGVSNCSMRVRLTLIEKALEWESHHLDLFKKEHITEDYFGINPNGLVPTLVHDGQVIIESDDIIEYLDETFPEPPLRPADSDELALTNQWLHRATEIHIKAVKTHIYNKRVSGNMSQSEEEKSRYESLQQNKDLLEFHRKSNSGGFSQAEIDAAADTLETCFADLDRTLTDKHWIAGGAFSLADIAWIPLYFTLGVLADFSFDAMPNLQAWAKRIEQRPSYDEAVLQWWPKHMLPKAKQSA
ncbi:MAG: glutathione S-transferase family protein [Pseudomonadota bacterium]